MSDWTHAPVHRTSNPGWYFITAGTYLKRDYLREDKRRYDFVVLLKRLASELSIELQAWVVMVNHYHVMIRSTLADSVLPFIRKTHSSNSHDLNAVDKA